MLVHRLESARLRTQPIPRISMPQPREIPRIRQSRRRSKASTQTAAIGTAVSNLDQYQTVTSVEIRFRSSHSALGQNSKDALDQLVSQSTRSARLSDRRTGLFNSPWSGRYHRLSRYGLGRDTLSRHRPSGPALQDSPNWARQRSSDRERFQQDPSWQRRGSHTDA